MNRAFTFNKVTSPSSQRGVTLIVALFIVLLMGILSLSAIRGSGMQESMAGNMRDKSLAFQAAESALREGESVVMKPGSLPAFNGVNGLHLELIPQLSPITYSDEEWVDGFKVKITALSLGVYAEPSYVVEELQADMGKEAIASGSGVDADSLYLETVPYRVTVRGVGLTSDSVVKLQSHLKRIP
jgi:type IV pilus assembly protein PilX